MTSAVAPYDARAVANFLLNIADDSKSSLTQLALLKIIYFSHGWYLVGFDRPLVKQYFEAWKYGPVIKVVRDSFKSFRDKPISGRAMRFDVLTGETAEVVPNISGCDQEFLRTIYAEYGGIDGWNLSIMTHEPNSPWDKVWNSGAPMGRLSLRLRDSEIRNHFLERTRAMRVS